MAAFPRGAPRLRPSPQRGALSTRPGRARTERKERDRQESEYHAAVVVGCRGDTTRGGGVSTVRCPLTCPVRSISISVGIMLPTRVDSGHPPPPLSTMVSGRSTPGGLLRCVASCCARCCTWGAGSRCYVPGATLLCPPARG